MLTIKVEPYWNVKDVGFETMVFESKIKVEPYWNVKEIQSLTIKKLKED